MRHGRGGSVAGLRKHYGSLVAVEDVSFEVEEGEIFGLLGPNGAGKTTTVECLQGRQPCVGPMVALGVTHRGMTRRIRERRSDRPSFSLVRSLRLPT